MCIRDRCSCTQQAALLWHFHLPSAPSGPLHPPGSESEAGAVNTACPVCVTDKSKCTGKAPEPPAETPEPEKEKPAGLNPAALILLLALLGGGGVFAYLKLIKNKPKTKGNDSLDDYDYGEEDSEEWETEDEEVLDTDVEDIEADETEETEK